jgi:hypothetical protein
MTVWQAMKFDKFIKFWVCGCISFFYRRHGTRNYPGLGLRIWKCGQCKTADAILDEIFAEEREAKKK